MKYAKSFVAASAIGLIGCLYSLPVLAYQTLKPEVRLSEYFSDNALLTPRRQKKTEWITDITSSLSLEREEKRYSYRLGYELQGLYYLRNTQADKVYNRGFFHFDRNVSDQKIDFSFNSRFSQEVLFPQAQLFNDFRSNDSRTEVAAYQLGPEIRTSLGPDLKNQLRLRYGQAHYVSQDIPHSTDYLIDGQLQSNTLWRKLTADLQYQYRQTQQINDVQAKTLQLNALIQYMINRHFSLLGQVGFEDSKNRENVQQNVDGFVWFAGVSYRPTRRTQIQVQRGERSFGESTIFSLSTIRRRHQININYSEDITTSAREQIDNTVRTDFNNLLATPNQFTPTFINQIIVSKRLEADYNYVMSRSQFTVTAYQVRNQLLNIDLIEQGKGLTLGLTHDLRQNLMMALSASKSIHRFFNFEEDKRYILSGHLDYQISRPLFFTMSYQHFLNHSSNLLRDTAENIGSIGFYWQGQ